MDKNLSSLNLHFESCAVVALAIETVCERMFVGVGEFEAAAEIADADAVTAAVFLFFGEVAIFGFKDELSL